MAELKQKKRSSYRLNCGRLLAVHKSMSWNDRNCSTSVTFLFVVILNHIPASHTMYNLYFIYIYIVQYTCSHQRKKNSKSPPPPTRVVSKSSEYPMHVSTASRRNVVYYQEQILYAGK